MQDKACTGYKIVGIGSHPNFAAECLGVWVQIGAAMAQMVKLVKEVYLRLIERGGGPKLEPTEEERQANDADYRERRMKLRKRRIKAKKAKLAGLHVSPEQGHLLNLLSKRESREMIDIYRPFPYSTLCLRSPLKR